MKRLFMTGSGVSVIVFHFPCFGMKLKLFDALLMQGIVLKQSSPTAVIFRIVVQLF
jgi:hypothetical protein